MRKLLFYIPIILFLSCENEKEVQIPLHSNSYDWKMTGFPLSYINNSGDTLEGLFGGELITYSRELCSDNMEAECESLQQKIQIDSNLELTITLNATFLQAERTDWLFWNLVQDGIIWTELMGQAEPDHILTVNSANYHDTLSLNNVQFTNVYSDSDDAQKLTMFVNRSNGLVGFILENDTFNLVN